MWAAIVGRGDEGRREAVDIIVAALQAGGFSVGGFVQQASMQGGERTGFDLLPVAGGARIALARISPDPLLCDYAFDTDAFARAKAWSLAEGADVTIVEAGKLEAGREGHWPVIEAVTASGPRLGLLLIRRNALAPIALRLPDPVAALDLPADQRECAAFVEELTAILRSPIAANG